MKPDFCKRKYGLILTAVLLLTAVLAGGITLWRMWLKPIDTADGTYLYIDADDTTDSVYNHIRTVGDTWTATGFRLAARLTGYRLHTGRYVLESGDNGLRLFRKLKQGRQTPLKLTLPGVRTLNRLAAVLGDRLMTDSATWAQTFGDTVFTARYGYDTATLPALFIPNTYEVYWDMSPEAFFDRMAREHDAFWTERRRQLAEEAGLTPIEAVTLASIVDEETANNGEKPMIAGMYINRLRTGMPLQADPTVKFALKDFGLRRIYHKHLEVESPYNTYRNTGLPPGPIRIPSIAGVDAVLNHVHHDYLYMCAKEDFSGTHNFARTYREHLANAARYVRALEKRQIK
ncbi:MAG: endolytic transglycosylase MltG [Paraprevotella sp.]|nr:endolytic transglycosylase MltG [Paraprevotella sp.]